MRKAKRHATLKRVHDEFTRIAKSEFNWIGARPRTLSLASPGFQDENHPLTSSTPVCVVHREGGGVESISAHNFEILCARESVGMEVGAIQAHPPVRTSESGMITFSHEYRLNAVGVPQHQALRLGVDPSVTGHRSTTAMASKNKVGSTPSRLPRSFSN